MLERSRRWISPSLAFTTLLTTLRCLTPTYANQDDPLIFKNGNTSSFQLLSYAGALQSFSFDLGNATVYRELVGGSKEVLITDRAAGWLSLYRGCGLMATKDYFAAAVDDDAALGNLAVHSWHTAGNIVQFTSSKVDIGDVAYGDSDGIAMLEIPVHLCAGCCCQC